MFPILQIGPFAIQIPGLVLLLGVCVGLEPADCEAPRHTIKADTIDRLVFVGLLGGLLGARLWNALRYLDVYLTGPAGPGCPSARVNAEETNPHRRDASQR